MMAKTALSLGLVAVILGACATKDTSDADRDIGQAASALDGTWSVWEHIGGNILDKPAVTATSTGKLDVIVRNVDNVAYNKVFNPGGGWWPSQTGWANIGGALGSAPAAARRGDYLDLIAQQQTDSSGINKVYDPNIGWWPSTSGWNAIGGFPQTTPVVTSWSTDRLDVIAASTNNHAIYKYWDSADGWMPSQTTVYDLGGPLYGTLQGAPTMVTWGVGHLDVAALGTNSQAYVRPCNDGYWLATWVSLGTQQFAEAPALASWGPNHLDVIGRGTDGHAYSKVRQSSGWWPSQLGGWTDLGGSLAGPISAVSWGVGRLDLVARGTGGTLLYKYWDASTNAWSPSQTGWTNIAGTVTINGDPVMVSSGPGQLDIFVRGTYNHVWHIARTP